MKYLLILLSFVCLTQHSFAQKKKDKNNNVVFGLQYRPIIPNEIFNTETIDLTSEILSATLENNVGHSFGFLIRRNFTEHWSLETGISSIKRNFTINAVHDSTRETSNFTMGMQTYEVPVEALYYVKLGENLYMNSLAGVSFNIYPTQLAKVAENLFFSAKSARKSWVGLSLLVNIGFEYRTRDAGYFYLGASLHRPINDISQFQIDYRPDNVNLFRATSWYTGNFFSIDLRYFFQADEVSKKKKKKKDD